MEENRLQTVGGIIVLTKALLISFNRQQAGEKYKELLHAGVCFLAEPSHGQPARVTKVTYTQDRVS